jgi:hypothetical protein
VCRLHRKSPNEYNKNVCLTTGDTSSYLVTGRTITRTSFLGIILESQLPAFPSKIFLMFLAADTSKVHCALNVPEQVIQGQLALFNPPMRL